MMFLGTKNILKTQGPNKLRYFSSPELKVFIKHEAQYG